MRIQCGRTVGTILALVLASTLGACHGPTTSGGAGGSPGVKVNPRNAQAAARSGPPANATQQTSIGSGPASINTSNSPSDTDSSWVGQIDIDGDGDVEETQFLWDDEDKVLFAYAQTDVPCKDGGTATTAILTGVNGAGNPRGRRAGSGFYAAHLDASECEAAMAGLYACTFDADGHVTAWASATINRGEDTVILGRNVRNPLNPFGN